MFTGRYGNDKLNKTLLYTAIGLSLMGLLFGFILPRAAAVQMILSGCSVVLLALAIARMFSRSFGARQKELQQYLLFEGRVKAWWHKARRRARGAVDIEEHRNYKHLSCPQCMQKLRVPRGKGKLRVTCAKCRHKFDVKS